MAKKTDRRHALRNSPVSALEIPSAMRYVPTGTREKILFTALELIAESGSLNFSLNAICRRGNFSKGSMYFHFKNLEEICMGCYELIQRFMAPKLNSEKCRSVKEFLERFGEEFLERTSNENYFTMVFFFGELAMTQPKFKVAQKQLTEAYLKTLSLEFKRLASKKVREERVVELVSFMAIMLDGIASHRLMFEDPLRMRHVWKLVVETISRELDGE